MFIQLYKALIRPHLEYATVVWNPCLKKDVFLIESVQRRATRLVSEIRHLSYEERLRKLGLPTLNYRRCRNDMIQVYKVLNQIDSIPANKFFTLSEESRTRGHKYKLVKGHNRTRHKASIFPQRVVNPWNKLPSSCVESDSINSFKSALSRLGSRKTGLSPPVFYTDRSKAVLLLWFLTVTCSCCPYLYFGSAIMLVTYFVNFR